MARRHQPIAQADWHEAEVSWSGLTPGQLQVARRVYDELLALEWLTWPARVEALRRAQDSLRGGPWWRWQAMTRDELLKLIRHDPEVRGLLADAVMQTVAARIDNRKQRRAATHGATAADVADQQPAPEPPMVEPDPFGDDDRVELTELGRDALRTRSEQAVG